VPPKVISVTEAEDLIARDESHFWDHKSVRSGGAAIEKIGTALANADGGEFAVGIEDKKVGDGLARWLGFSDEEAGNHVHQALVNQIDPPVPYSIEWLQIEDQPDRGPRGVGRGPKERLSPSELKEGGMGSTRRAEFAPRRERGRRPRSSKGTRSYEDQLLDKYAADELADEPELASFLDAYSPRTEPAAFVQKQRLIDKATSKASVAGAVLYAESPSAVIPKKCAVKVARYETTELEPRREHLAGTPETIEGPARAQIEETLTLVRETVEALKIMEPDGTLAPARYPPEALREVIVNAVIHRNYNIRMTFSCGSLTIGSKSEALARFRPHDAGESSNGAIRAQSDNRAPSQQVPRRPE
jgi:ATP-dependent DNA helicase RecG